MVLTLGAAVRQLRHAAGMSQSKLASAAGIQATYLSHIEADRREPTMRVLRQIAGALGLPPSFLLSIMLMVDLPEEDRAVYEVLLTQLLNIATLGSDARHSESNHD